MTDSGSFSSLMALVDSHLSKTSVEAGEGSGLPTLGGTWNLPGPPGPGETLSETRLSLTPAPRLPLPTLSFTESPIQQVLVQQVNNMIKAKELMKQKEEAALAARERAAKEMRELKMQNDVIDLVKAVNESMTFQAPEPPKEEPISSSSSCESLYQPKYIDCDLDSEVPRILGPLLPCRSDLSHIMKENVKQGRCSTFGKVLASRMKPVAAPYVKERVRNNKVVRFDFTTKSPCDLIKERLRAPRAYPNKTFDLFSDFPDLDLDLDS